jgi:hypothetical protein
VDAVILRDDLEQRDSGHLVSIVQVRVTSSCSWTAQAHAAQLVNG